MKLDSVNCTYVFSVVGAPAIAYLGKLAGAKLKLDSVNCTYAVSVVGTPAIAYLGKLAGAKYNWRLRN